MENKFPYKGDVVTVSKDMCDMNGHMNVAFYSKIFDEGSESRCPPPTTPRKKQLRGNM